MQVPITLEGVPMRNWAKLTKASKISLLFFKLIPTTLMLLMREALVRIKEEISLKPLKIITWHWRKIRKDRHPQAVVGK